MLHQLISYISYQFMVFQAKELHHPKGVLYSNHCLDLFIQIPPCSAHMFQLVSNITVFNTDKNLLWKSESQALERQLTWHHTWYTHGEDKDGTWECILGRGKSSSKSWFSGSLLLFGGVVEKQYFINPPLLKTFSTASHRILFSIVSYWEFQYLSFFSNSTVFITKTLWQCCVGVLQWKGETDVFCGGFWCTFFTANAVGSP